MKLGETYENVLAAYPPVQRMIAGERWTVIQAGTGPTVVLLPGGFGLAATSFQYIAALASDYHVIALSYPPRLNQVAQLTSGVVAILDACGVGAAHIVGGSASGGVAQVLVRHHPQRIATLILAQTGAPRRERAWLDRLIARACEELPAALILGCLRLAVHAFLPGRSEEMIFWRWHFAGVIGEQTRASLAARFQTLADYDHNYRFTPEDLQAWPGRIAIIEAPQDRMLPANEQAALRSLYPQATVYRLAGTAHRDSVTNPLPQIELVRTIIKGRPPIATMVH
ncbi:alpha/beta hydrolase [Candidatus Chloroploca sp. M-50]|uniref:Alpha/beta hydrolase n=1 Tax=Candidatus Chloroploca mongolica TaxID=2528176 RepID=A0ABS4DCK3_9CHLR|nr:alpha/beta hydrolase [Candidatus Chloroploca mongolica]MBP1467171.1 alpha/beta hydrolase [Candidatus Chloroploca mongolica]